MTTETVPPAPRTLAAPRVGSTAAWSVIGALVVVGCWAVADLRINAATFIDGARNAVGFAGRTLPLDFPPAGELLRLSGQTLAIVISATVLSVILSIPLAILAAANTTPGTGARLGARALIVMLRSVPDVVMAIVFFRIFGLGAMTGVLAMGLHSTGMVAKLYADAIEHVDEGPRAAIRASGAGAGQELTAGVLPQVMPAFVATALHRIDINLRISVLLGFVGVNGLGYAIATAFKQLDYRRGMALAAVVLALCVLVESLSGSIRRALLRETGGQSTHSPPLHTGGQISPPWTAARMRRAGYAVLTVLVVLTSAWGADLDPIHFVNSLRGIAKNAGLFWPPGTAGIFGQLWSDLWLTVKIALGATLIGAALALPIGCLAARNVAPNPRVAQMFRIFVVLIRGIPELVLAVVFVVITGLGAVAGTLALSVGSIGLLGKLVADSLEEVDPGPQRAIHATGAGRGQVFFTGTLPQAAPSFIAHVLYQLDVNIRAATLLGIVGAGGIGFDLLSGAQVLEFDLVTTILLMVFVTVLAVEALAVWLRHEVS
ncbi:phosphonate ABC transporter permease [Mycobacterium florentinum]|uniref:Phosphonate ABC transporter permease n=1 Tax=Mycobacterium florentinum TaxID=292462 RepID=A0A1X1U5C8_MYCFL|nr:phosphonate ABC transporter, permease protein PhnE [Mycobacterium florentinum]MCV7410358.1 phosphonate ABC transporter, permease protein PhnE [Mycobacterium florentinum]ORV52052.1 phosphonate ABC transporter permease [Mycobacterium florentinum]BBX79676.1 phosphate-import permease protein PhnE [Mycobacterium florentinum]